MSWLFCTSGSAVAKAGAHCNAVSGSEVTMAKWSDEAEGAIMLRTNIDFSGSYTSLTPQIKNALSDVCSSYVAMDIIQYDTTGYYAREADTLMNRNDEIINVGIKELENGGNLKTY